MEELKLTGKNDIKIFILFLLDSIGYPLSRSDIEEICVSDNFVSYFDFAECFVELVDKDYLILINEGETELYSGGVFDAVNAMYSSLTPVEEIVFDCKTNSNSNGRQGILDIM